jgi:Holliday junction resolvase-like predicted endonuclease
MERLDRRRETGAGGEQRAVEYLKQRGYTIIERNWRSPHGRTSKQAKQ